ncbi:MAG: PEP-CTERM sorting domain-containing protein [Acidobacteriota bacterium]|nr:PEP-CTERM sorting domain-containing protein [Acidobacteriota bacterium]
MTTKKLVFALALLVLPLVATCQAGVIYTFTGTSSSEFPPVVNTGFQYTSPSLITSQVTILLSQLDSCVGCGLPPNPDVPVVFFTPDSCSTGIVVCYDSIQFNDFITNTGYMYYFPVGTFDSPGSYVTDSYGAPAVNSGTLTVSPEPSTVFMLVSGILPTALFRRRKRTSLR